jgi:porphobilinogen synthase
MVDMAVRLRRLRRTGGIRSMVRETALLPDDFILPLFISEEEHVSCPLPAIPGAKILSGRHLVEEVREVADLGIPAVLLFGMLPESARDERASAAYSPNGAIQRAVQAIRKAVPDMVVITDLCLCEYTDHGHCGLLRNGEIDNDMTLDCIRTVAVSHAEAGADIIAPSGMMDGVVRAIREALDESGQQQVMTMPYSAKFESRFYGPFKDATNSVPSESLHATHQLDIANSRQALAEIRRDVEEGADIVIVKPALTSLDIIAQARQAFSLPIAAYDVSGTYALFYNAAGTDLVERNAIMMEILTCIRRSGADLVITYYAKEGVRYLRQLR